MHRAASLLLVATMLLLDGEAHAGACCISASAFGVGRLAVWEDFALLLNTAGSPSMGRWDEYRAWHAESDGTSDTEWRASLAGIVAVHPRVQLWGKLPLLLTNKQITGLSESGGGFGDAQAGARLEVLTTGQIEHLPAVALNVGFTVPTGRANQDTRKILASDVTGRGVWVLSAGVTLEHVELPWYVQLSAGVLVPLPQRNESIGADQRLGAGLDGALAGGVELHEGLVVSLLLRANREADQVVAGHAVINSSAFDVGLGPTVSWEFVSHLTAQAGLDGAIFRTGFGDNRPGRVTASAGLRYGHF